jgi:hypothetical protein
VAPLEQCGREESRDIIAGVTSRIQSCSSGELSSVEVLVGV